MKTFLLNLFSGRTNLDLEHMGKDKYIYLTNTKFQKQRMIDLVENSRVSVQVAHFLKKIFYYEQGLISSQMKVTFLSDLLVYDFKG
jgi:hypothetical protein